MALPCSFTNLPHTQIEVGNPDQYILKENKILSDMA